MSGDFVIQQSMPTTAADEASPAPMPASASLHRAASPRTPTSPGWWPVYPECKPLRSAKAPLPTRAGGASFRGSEAPTLWLGRQLLGVVRLLHLTALPRKSPHSDGCGLWAPTRTGMDGVVPAFKGLTAGGRKQRKGTAHNSEQVHRGLRGPAVPEGTGYSYSQRHQKD